VDRVERTPNIQAQAELLLLGALIEYLPDRSRLPRIVISDGRPSLSMREYGSTGYVTARSSRSEFFREYRVEGSVLGITENTISTIMVVDAQGVLIPEFGSTIIVKNSREIFGTWEGVFYLMTRQRPCV